MTESACFGGQLNHTVKMQTALNLHWNAFRRFVGFVNPSTPVSVADVLVVGRLHNYFKHLQTQPSSRGLPYSHNSITPIGRNLVTLYEAMVKPWVEKAASTKVITSISNFARSVAQVLARASAAYADYAADWAADYAADCATADDCDAVDDSAHAVTDYVRRRRR